MSDVQPNPPCVWCKTDDGCDCAERIACTEAGTFGHLSCGWCDKHNAPASQCLCGVERFNAQIRIYNGTSQGVQ